jgi:DNA polymerase type B, organellar and viral
MTQAKPNQSRLKRLEISEGVSKLAKELFALKQRAFAKQARVKDAKPATLIAYDFETTRIAKGSPVPLYLTAYSPHFSIETRIRDFKHLRLVLPTQFLTAENDGAKFVAWNGNRFDAYFIAAAMVEDSDFIIKPYMTKSKSVRGVRIERLRDGKKVYAEKNRPVWEFLDGIAMLGLAGTSLEKFLKTFAPEHHKLTGVIDFEREEFDPDNPHHREYAMRDSVGLWHGMQRAQSIMIENFNEPLRVTMGGACIRVFQSHLPDDVRIVPLNEEHTAIVRDYAMRGGFCYCAQQYHGPVWKYDINQAYAGAMRDAELPSGSIVPMTGNPHKLKGCYLVCVEGEHPTNTVPFYCRTEVFGRISAVFATTKIPMTWITSSEHQQLLREGWKLTYHGVLAWNKSFSMKDYVDKLERIRTTCEGGPNGAIGTMIKATGNHSYGKTVENIAPISYVIAAECPPGFQPFYDEGIVIEHIFYQFDDDRKPKDYHQPHIGAFITAHVRMQLRREILKRPAEWLYADTDCLVFAQDMGSALDIDPMRYGAWKVEEAGATYQIIAKKVYAQTEHKEARDFNGPPNPKHKRSAKGMNVKKLSADDFSRWMDGEPPTQTQIQLNNFLAVLTGAEMYREQIRKGTSTQAKGK